MDAARKVPGSNVAPVGRQSALDMLRSMAGSVGNDSTLSKQLAAISTPETTYVEQSISTVTQHTGRSIQLIPAPDMPSNVSASKQNIPESSSGPRNPFHVDTAQLRAVPLSQQASEIQNLGLTVYDQQDFEDDIMNQMDRAMAQEEKDRMERILVKSMKSVEEDIRTTKQELIHMDKVLLTLKPNIVAQNKEAQSKLEAIRRQQDNKQKQLKKLKAKERALRNKLHGSTGEEEEDEDVSALGAALGLTSKNETETERMIRLGEMTPFGTAMANVSKANGSVEQQKTSQVSEFEKYLMDQNKKSANKKKTTKKKPSAALGKSKSTVDLKQEEPIAKISKLEKSKSFADLRTKEFDSTHAKQKQKSLSNRFDEKDKRQYSPKEKDFSNYKQRNRRYKLKHQWTGDPDISDYSDGEEGFDPDDREWRPDGDEYLDEDDVAFRTAGTSQAKSKKSSKRVKISANSDDSQSSAEFDSGQIKAEFGIKQPKATGGSAGTGNRRAKDDGDEKAYKKRLERYKKDRLRKKQQRIIKENDPDAQFDDLDDDTDSDEEQDMEFEGGFKVPGKLWKKLYRYQKTGVKWLWELHVQQAGGIVGDEMGLGKTIQTIAFLSGLRHSKLRDKGANTRYLGLGPTLIVCPATVMHQWVREFHQWAPLFRVAILHSSGSYGTSPERLVRSVALGQGILITSFSTMVIYQDTLLEHDWHYVILDEGHKIRNPDAQVTLAAKQFRTCHRIILSGSPVQNNVKELWSLFDFVFPGKLGTLPDFMAHFSVPIVQGGYANATEVQVQTAYKCACVLRDTINPYLLRRMKADVQTNLQLPNKNEQVLFCRLTDEQKDVYQEYLDSKECHMILSGNFMVFPGLITLRKICNHPDISTGGPSQFDQNFSAEKDECKYGYFKRSGKMVVVESLLKLWQKQGHRVLLFTQSKQMLDILEIFVKDQNYRYMRMDGGTSIAARQPLINKFNSDESYFVFLLTTRVGGLGVNLTGANRIIIFDPDWNPSTDLQARERAWRIGQKKQVTIYRLLTTGTIEEKIYHRQIFKQFLTNRVLKDPKQRRFFKSNDLFELFTLGDDDRKMSTETSAIFAGTGSDVKVKTKKTATNVDDDEQVALKKRNRFDEMRERELKEEKESTKDEKQTEESSSKEQADEEDDGDCGLDAARIKEMKELARKLSRQFMEDRGKSKEEASAKKASKTDGSSEGKEAQNKTGNQNDMQKAQTISSNSGETYGNGTEKLKDTKESKCKEKHKKKKEKEKSKKKKKKKAKDAMIDGEKIEYLDRHEMKKIEEDLDQEAESAKQDDYVLQSLFKKSGAVHSAMQHDTIMMSSNPDYALVEGEADRVAKQAARALKESRARCFGARTGVPTWTGTSGAGGAPPKPRFGQKKNSKLNNPDGVKAAESPVKKVSEKKKEVPVQPTLFDGSVAGNVRTHAASASAATPNVMSSTQLLSRMKSRNRLALGEPDSDEDEDDGMPRNPHRHSSDIDKDDLELITDIRNYVAYQAHMDGRASTQELLEEFKQRVPANESAKFKAMLKQVCDYDKINGVGMWFLKQEFK